MRSKRTAANLKPNWPERSVSLCEYCFALGQDAGLEYSQMKTTILFVLAVACLFPSTKWGFVEFGTSARTAKPLPPDSNCQTCHSMNGAVDQTFVQFYPTLIPVAKAKGTFKSTNEK